MHIVYLKATKIVDVKCFHDTHTHTQTIVMWVDGYVKLVLFPLMNCLYMIFIYWVEFSHFKINFTSCLYVKKLPIFVTIFHQPSIPILLISICFSSFMLFCTDIFRHRNLGILCGQIHWPFSLWFLLLFLKLENPNPSHMIFINIYLYLLLWLNFLIYDS